MLSSSALHAETGYTMFFTYKEIQNMSSVEFIFNNRYDWWDMFYFPRPCFQTVAESVLRLPEIVDMGGNELPLKYFLTILKFSVICWKSWY